MPIGTEDLWRPSRGWNERACNLLPQQGSLFSLTVQRRFERFQRFEWEIKPCRSVNTFTFQSKCNSTALSCIINNKRPVDTGNLMSSQRVWSETTGGEYIFMLELKATLCFDFLASESGRHGRNRDVHHEETMAWDTLRDRKGTWSWLNQHVLENLQLLRRTATSKIRIKVIFLFS